MKAFFAEVTFDLKCLLKDESKPSLGIAGRVFQAVRIVQQLRGFKGKGKV